MKHIRLVQTSMKHLAVTQLEMRRSPKRRVMTLLIVNLQYIEGKTLCIHPKGDKVDFINEIITSSQRATSVVTKSTKILKIQ